MIDSKDIDRSYHEIILTDKSNKFNDDYQLTDEKPMICKSQFLKDNDTSKNDKNIKKLSYNGFEALLYYYYNLFEKIENDKIKEIFNHGIMAIDLNRIKDESYINKINHGLYSFNKDIIPELNNVYNKFKEKYDIYLNENQKIIFF